MEVIISIISLLVIVVITVVLLYQNASVRDNTTAKMQSMVDKINDANYYTFQYDKKQEHNIKTLDDNINTVAGDVRNVYGELQTFKPTVVSRKELAELLTTKQLTADDLTLQDRYMFKYDDQGNWLRLNGKDGKFKDGWAMDKLYVEKDTMVKGNIHATKIHSDTIEVKGGKSTLNPNNITTRFAGSDGMNYVAGDTNIVGNLESMGAVTAARGINARDTVKIAKDQYGMFIENKSANGAAMGLGSYANNELRLMNGADTGHISFGLGNSSTFDALATMSKTNTSKTVNLGGTTGLRVINSTNDTAKTKQNDVVVRTEANTNMLSLQSGNKAGVDIKDGLVTIGNNEDLTSTKMDVYGNVLVRGNEMRLGYNNPVGGDTGNSRAMVKNNSELIFNFNNDYPQGSTFHSDLGIVNGKCVEVGKNTPNKDAAAGKICYAKYSDGVDIVGAGTAKSQRSVRVWDRLETDEVKSGKLCIGDTCIFEEDLKRFKNAITPNGLCINNDCFTQAHVTAVKKLFTPL